MSKHTEGPWQIAPHTCEDDDGGIYIVSDYKMLPDGRCQANWIAEFDLQQDRETNWANARLAIAAPDLLEALEELVYVIKLIAPNATCEPATAAIAKAKGTPCSK